MSIGDRIQQLRKKHGMTQEELAMQIGATRQAISKWEAGKSYPDIDYAVKIGDCFHVSMDFLLTGKEYTSLQSTENASHKKDYRWKFICFGCLLVIGIALALLLPLLMDLYHNYRVGSFQSFHKNLINYYCEWPMLGIVILSVGLSLTGIGGLIWLYRKQLAQWINAD